MSLIRKLPKPTYVLALGVFLALSLGLFSLGASKATSHAHPWGCDYIERQYYVGGVLWWVRPIFRNGQWDMQHQYWNGVNWVHVHYVC
jgi:hypothetical protein